MTEAIFLAIAALCANGDYAIQRQCQRDLVKCVLRNDEKKLSYAGSLAECLLKRGDFK